MKVLCLIYADRRGQLPCFFFFLMCFVMWINFSRYGSDAMYIYYPVLLVGVSAIVLFFPGPILYYRTRAWFLYAMVSKSDANLSSCLC